MKIFISYSRFEASETAKILHNYLSESGNHEVFIDTSDIHGGDEWWKTIKENISDCNIFVILVTRSALERQYVKEEVELAKKLEKRIIPCISKRYIRNVVLPLGLNKYQGIEYENLDQLIQEMGHMFESLEKYESEQSDPTFINQQNLKIPTQKDKNSSTDTTSKEQSFSYPTGKITNRLSVKIFISYSRRDADDFVMDIHKKFDYYYEILPSIDTIKWKQVWDPTIKSNISDCDIFIVLVTYGALQSKHVENEVLQAQEEKKKIIPCFHTSVIDSDIKCGLEKIHGIEFDDASELRRNLIPLINKNIKEKEDNITKSDVAKEQNGKIQYPHLNFHRTKFIIIPIIAIAIIGGIIGLIYFNELAPADEKEKTLPIPSTTTNTTDNVVNPPTITDSLQTYQFIKAWGTEGTGNGKFNSPQGIAVDSSAGHVYVADFANNRIQKFDSNGTFITKWGSKGTGNGEFNSPQGIAIDSRGYVYVADMNNNRIQKFDDNGEFITNLELIGERIAMKEFPLPTGIAIDSSGYVYVVDTINSRIQGLDKNGTFITRWGNEGMRDEEFYTQYGIVIDSSFDTPYGIVIDSSDSVYVSDASNNLIKKFDRHGNFITEWGNEGTGDGEFNSPTFMAVDSSDNVYVVDNNNNRIQKFDSNGSFITKWGSKGTGDGEFSSPSGIAIDSKGNVYVADTANYRIQVFAPAPE